MKLPYDPVCTSIGRSVGLFVIFSLKGKRFTFIFLSEHLLTLVLSTLKYVSFYVTLSLTFYVSSSLTFYVTLSLTSYVTLFAI